MKTSWWKAAGVAALGIACNSPAFAQVVEVGTYYETRTVVTCSSGSICYLYFPQFPTAKLVMLEKIHCYIARANTMEEVFLGISNSQNSVWQDYKRRIPIQFEARDSESPYKRYFVNSDIRFLVGQGKYVSVLSASYASSYGNMECTLIGRTMTNYPTD